jgi:hypothetical protein
MYEWKSNKASEEGRKVRRQRKGKSRRRRKQTSRQAGERKTPGGIIFLIISEERNM